MVGDSTTSAAAEEISEERERGDDADRSFGGNRWPRQETLALLNIRSEMDLAFRDATVKGPLWEQVSRKLAELGYHRSAKKCKEKFENVYKYHKRTKEVRTGKSDGKNYKFFEQLEALDHHPQPNFHSPQPKTPNSQISQISPISPTVPLMNISFSQPNPTILPPPPPPAPAASPANIIPPPFPTSFHMEADLISNSTSSSSTSSDERSDPKKKRKWKDFFERLMREVIQKQEEMQRRFLEAIEKREHERVVREEAWRMQEMAKINREREILAQERSMAAAKDAAITSFLQKITNEKQSQPTTVAAAAAAAATATATQPPLPMPVAIVQVPEKSETQMEIMTKQDYNGGESSFSMSPGAASSSRWPKMEVQALIKLRTNLETKYQENGPKGPLWEEISAAMRKIGYNRSSKRCKEKWENINKYYKKVKESKKMRRDDSKTCPYFHQLEALYKEKSNKIDNITGSSASMLQLQQPLMVRPEQQWPPEQEMTRPDSANEEMESEPLDRDDKDGDEDDEEEELDEEEEEEDEENGGNYEIVASKPAPVSAAE